MLNAISLLKDDHQRISGLFDLFARSERLNEKLTLFQQIKEELELHSFVEEKVFYPALSKFYELSDIIDTCYDEHDEMSDLVDEIDQMEPESDELAVGDPDRYPEKYPEKYSDAVEELYLIFQRHVKEEESEVFRGARDLLNPEQLEDLASEMNQLRGLGQVA